MRNYDFAKSLTVGDKLAVRSRSYRPSYTVYEVHRLTATQAVASVHGALPGPRDIRVRLKDSAVVGQDYTYAEPLTPEVIRSVEREELTTWFVNFEREIIKKLTNDQLKRIRAICEEPT